MRVEITCLVCWQEGGEGVRDCHERVSGGLKASFLPIQSPIIYASFFFTNQAGGPADLNA